MRHAIGLMALAGVMALGATAQNSQPRYESVAPKRPAPRPLDPADVATLTGRPVSAEVTALPQKPSQAEMQERAMEPKSYNNRPPVNQADVDVLTGKYDRNRPAGYLPGWEALWTADWVSRHERSRHNDQSFFKLDRFGRDGIFLHDRGARHSFFRSGRFGRGGTIIFLP